MSSGAHTAAEPSRASGSRRRRADLTSWRGHLWVLVIALDFYLLSNPLVFEPLFGVSLQRAVLITAVAVVVSIPWLRVPRVSPLLGLFFLWGLASVLWSSQQGPTVAAVGLYLTLAALAVVTCANVDGSVLALGFVYGGLVVTATSVYAFNERLPNAYYEALEGTVIAGVGTNQNILAYTITLAMCGWLALWPRTWWRAGLWLVAGAGLLHAIQLSQSTTGYLAAGAVFATALAQWLLSLVRGREWSRQRLRTWAMVVGAASVAAVVALGFSGYGPGTFSDRLPFWRAAMSVAGDHPIVGNGWGAVWAHPWLPAPPNPVVDSIYEKAGTFLTHGHNSFVDLILELGAVGALLMLALVASAVWTATRRAETVAAGSPADAVRSRWMILCVVDLLVFGITEPMLVIPIGFWALVLLLEPPGRRRGSGGRHQGGGSRALPRSQS